MTNDGPNLIHAMDLAQLKKMGVTTNELDESSIVTEDKCPNCSASGFAPSELEGQCEFCDGSFGGNPPNPEQERVEQMCTMYGSQLYPHQKEMLYRLMGSDFKGIEERIYANQQAIRSNGKSHMQTEYFKLMYEAVFEPMPFQAYTKSRRYRSDGAIEKPSMIWLDDYIPTYVKDYDYVPDRRDEKDWKRTQFQQDTASSTPSAAKRAKLRAKRKKRK